MGREVKEHLTTTDSNLQQDAGSDQNGLLKQWLDETAPKGVAHSGLSPGVGQRVKAFVDLALNDFNPNAGELARLHNIAGWLAMKHAAPNLEARVHMAESILENRLSSQTGDQTLKT